MNENVSNINLVFSTPIWASLINNYEELNINILKYVKSIQENDPIGTSKSNISGWHSKNFNLNDKDVEKFFEAIKPNMNVAISDMGWDDNQNEIKVTSAWSIINKRSASNSRHIHSNNYLSAAYYVCAPKDCGDIIFYDPRDAKVIRKPSKIIANKLNSEVVNISPQAGLLVLFPSYLHHSVEENKSNNDRIVISFNIDIK